MDITASPHLEIYDPHKICFDFMDVPYYEDEIRDFDINPNDPQFDYLFEILPFFHHKMFVIFQNDSSLFWDLIEQLYDYYREVQNLSRVQKCLTCYGFGIPPPSEHHHNVARDYLFAHLLNIEDV
jgi:hypothetical protein